MANEQSNGIQLQHGKQQGNSANKLASKLQTQLEQPSAAQSDPADQLILDAKKELEGMTHIAFSIV
jgi:hypothetical protein